MEEGKGGSPEAGKEDLGEISARLELKISEAILTLKGLVVPILEASEEKFAHIQHAQQACQDAARRIHSCKKELDKGRAPGITLGARCQDAMRAWEYSSKELHTILDPALRNFDDKKAK